jgi:hypothetical protein
MNREHYEIKEQDTDKEIKRIYDEIDFNLKHMQFDWIKIDGLKLIEGTEDEVTYLLEMIEFRQKEVQKLRRHRDILYKYKDNTSLTDDE